MKLIDIIQNIALAGVKDKKLRDAEIDEIVIREERMYIYFANENKDSICYYLDEQI